MKMDDKIIMMISHRVYNIMGCNRVIVIDKGKILEEGNPHRLIEDHNSAFYKIYNNIFIRLWGVLNDNRQYKIEDI